MMCKLTALVEGKAKGFLKLIYLTEYLRLSLFEQLIWSTLYEADPSYIVQAVVILLSL